MTKVMEIPVHCWNCGEVFYIEIANVRAGELFCSNECKKDNLKNKLKIGEERERLNDNQKLYKAM